MNKELWLTLLVAVLVSGQMNHQMRNYYPQQYNRRIYDYVDNRYYNVLPNQAVRSQESDDDRSESTSGQIQISDRQIANAPPVIDWRCIISTCPPCEIPPCTTVTPYTPPPTPTPTTPYYTTPSPTTPPPTTPPPTTPYYTTPPPTTPPPTTPSPTTPPPTTPSPTTPYYTTPPPTTPYYTTPPTTTPYYTTPHPTKPPICIPTTPPHTNPTYPSITFSTNCDFCDHTLYTLTCIPNAFECAALCANDRKCTHFTYVANLNGGTCYLKSAPGSGGAWASHVPAPSFYTCGYITKRSFSSFLLNICLGLDIGVGIGIGKK